MKKLVILSVLWGALSCVSVFGQALGTATRIRTVSPAPSGACSPEGSVRVNGSGLYLCGGGTWGVVGGGGSGTGDVTGPASATDNAIARFDGTTGKLIQNSGASIDDSGNLTAVSLKASGLTSGRIPLVGSGGLLQDDDGYKYAINTGTTPDTYRLLIGNKASGADLLSASIDLYGYGVTADNAIRLVRFEGTPTAPTSVTSGNSLGSVQWLGRNTALSATGIAAVINVKASENFGTNTGGTVMEFDVTRTGVSGGTGSQTGVIQLSIANNDNRLLLFNDAATGYTKGGFRWNNSLQSLQFTNNGATWNDISAGGSPGGSTKQVQFNNAGAFGGAAGFEYQAGASPTVRITGQFSGQQILKLESFSSEYYASVLQLKSGGYDATTNFIHGPGLKLELDSRSSGYFHVGSVIKSYLEILNTDYGAVAPFTTRVSTPSPGKHALLVEGAASNSAAVLVAKGGSSGTGNLIEAQDSAGTAKAFITINGRLVASSGGTGGVYFDGGTGGANNAILKDTGENELRWYSSLQVGGSLGSLGLLLRSDGTLAWGTSTNPQWALGTGGRDTGLARNRAGWISLTNGSTGAGSLTVPDVSGTDQAGLALTFGGGRGTGTGAGGAINFQVAPAGSTGGSVNSLVTAASITTRKTINVVAIATPTQSDGDFYNDSSINAFTAVSGNLRGAVNSTTATSSGTKTVTATTDTSLVQLSLWSATSIPANYLTTNKQIIVEGGGFYSTGGAVTTPTVKLKLGSTTVVTGTNTLLSSGIGNYPFRFRLTLVTISTGATGTVHVHGSVDWLDSSGIWYATPVVTTAAQTINTTTAQAVDVTLAWSNSGNSATLTGLRITN